MRDSNKDDAHLISRRNALKALVATGGATALSTLPAQWERPLVQVGALPAFAGVVSPNQYSFTNEIESITFSGPGSDQLQAAAVPGWIVVAPVNTTVGTRSEDTFFPPGSLLPPWIISRPWLKIKRRWGVLAPPWSGVIRVKIKIKFKAHFTDSYILADDTELWCFGIAGGILSAFSYYIVKLKIKKHKIEFEYLLPAVIESGLLLYPFFLSCYFPFDIRLVSGGSLFPGYYVGPGIYGSHVASKFSSFLKK